MSKGIEVMEGTRMRLQTDRRTDGRHADRCIPRTYRSGDKKIWVVEYLKQEKTLNGIMDVFYFFFFFFFVFFFFFCLFLFSKRLTRK